MSRLANWNERVPESTAWTIIDSFLGHEVHTLWRGTKHSTGNILLPSNVKEKTASDWQSAVDSTESERVSTETSMSLEMTWGISSTLSCYSSEEAEPKIQGGRSSQAGQARSFASETQEEPPAGKVGTDRKESRFITGWLTWCDATVVDLGCSDSSKGPFSSFNHNRKRLYSCR